jgi:hypothetical protein
LTSRWFLFFIYRQGVHEWSGTLARIRIEEPTQEDINLLESRRLEKHKDANLQEAYHVFYTRIEVHNFNESKLNDLDMPLVEIKAIATYPNNYRPKVHEYGTVDSTPFYMKLCLKIGAEVMLTYNVCIADGLTNGLLGKILDIIEERDENQEMKVKCVIVVFENPDAGRTQRQKLPVYSARYQHQNGVPIVRETLEYQLPIRKTKKVHGVKGQICQFPLKLAWASTCHKLQGATIPKGKDLVCHGHRRIPSHMLYVMFSRTTSIDNLYLDENVDLKKIVCASECKQLQVNNTLNKRSIVESVKQMKNLISMVNVRSLQKHFEDVKVDHTLLSADIICLVETWITNKNAHQYQLEGYRMFHTSVGHGKGCVIYVANGKKSTFIEAITHPDYQVISILYCQKIQITLMYLSQNQKNNANLIDSLKVIWNPNYHHILLGDMNYDKEERSALTDFLKSKSMKQNVKGPTHVEGRTIDHCHTSSSLGNCKLKLFSPYYTDHKGLLIDF